MIIYYKHLFYWRKRKKKEKKVGKMNEIAVLFTQVVVQEFL